MPDINLLPWREELREERKRQFFSSLVLTAVLAAIIGFAWDSWIDIQISTQASRNNILETEISKLDAQANEIRELKRAKSEMLDRMEVIKGLQTNRPEVVKLYDQLVQVVPDGVYLSTLDVQGSKMSMQGKAESNNRISSMMRQIDQSGKFAQPNLTTVTADRELGDQGSNFVMTAQVIDQSEPESE